MAERNALTETLSVIREDTNIPEAAAYLGDNPVMDLTEKLARARRQAEADPYEPTSGYANFNLRAERDRNGIARKDAGEPTMVTEADQLTPAQRVYEGFAPLYPVEGGRVDPTPTDRQMASAILRVPMSAKAAEQQIAAAAEDGSKKKNDEPIQVAGAGDDWFSSLGRIFGFGKGEAEAKPSDPKTVEYKASPRKEYPTDVEAEFARASGFGYGTPAEPYINQQTARLAGAVAGEIKDRKGKTTSPAKFIADSPEGRTLSEMLDAVTSDRNISADLTKPEFKEARERLANIYAKAALTVEGNAIAKLGFNPNNITMNVSGDITQSTGGYRFQKNPFTGQPEKSAGEIWANAMDPSVLVHESMHAGLDKLRQTHPQQVTDLIRRAGGNEEDIVRLMMVKSAGDPEQKTAAGREDKGRKLALERFTSTYFGEGRTKAVDELIALAESEVARRRPGGPR